MSRRAGLAPPDLAGQPPAPPLHPPARAARRGTGQAALHAALALASLRAAMIASAQPAPTPVPPAYCGSSSCTFDCGSFSGSSMPLLSCDYAVCAGQTITASTCASAALSDTMLELYRGGTFITRDDDGCHTNVCNAAVPQTCSTNCTSLQSPNEPCCCPDDSLAYANCVGEIGGPSYLSYTSLNTTILTVSGGCNTDTVWGVGNQDLPQAAALTPRGPGCPGAARKRWTAIARRSLWRMLSASLVGAARLRSRRGGSAAAAAETRSVRKVAPEAVRAVRGCPAAGRRCAESRRRTRRTTTAAGLQRMQRRRKTEAAGLRQPWTTPAGGSARGRRVVCPLLRCISLFCVWRLCWVENLGGLPGRRPTRLLSRTPCARSFCSVFGVRIVASFFA